MPSKGRPHLPVGSWGSITVKSAPGSTSARPVYYARARFRDPDGETRSVLKSGQTKAAARRALVEVLTQRQAQSQKATLTVRELGEEWRRQRQAGWSQNTRSRYSLNLRYITDRLGSLRLSEVTRARVNTALQDVLDQHGVSAARQAKSTLSSMMGLALQMDLLDANPVRDSITIRTPPGTTKRPDALTPQQVDDLLALIRENESDRGDGTLGDLVTWMLGTGCRIGEACAARYVNLDPTDRTWEVQGTVVRVPKIGLRVQDRTKTEAGWRRIVLPPHLRAMVKRRQATEHAWGPQRPARELGLIFPSWVGTIWDPPLVSRQLRSIVGQKNSDGEYLWPDLAHITTHMFRRTAITRLDEAGLSSREIAVWAGHTDPALTQRVYMGRNIALPQAAQVLNRSDQTSH